MRLTQTSLGLFTLLFIIKTLGGGIHIPPLALVGLDTVHGPIIAALLLVLTTAFFLGVRPCTDALPHAPTPKQRTLFLALFLLIVGVALVERATAICTIPIDKARADMIPAVLGHLGALFSGMNPYDSSVTRDAGVIGFYLPLEWGVYAPAYLLGVDVRWTNLFAHGLFYFALLDLFLRKRSYDGRGFTGSAILFLLALSLHAFSKQARREVVDVQTAGLWIGISVIAWAIARQKLRLALITVSLFVFTRKPAFILVLPFFLQMFLRHRTIWLRTLPVMLACGALLALPVVWNWPQLAYAAAFYQNIVRDADPSYLFRFFGLVGVLKWAHLERAQLAFQYSGLGVALWLVYARSKSSIESLALGGMAYTVFMVFVATPFAYVYAETVILTYFFINLPSTAVSRTSR